MRLCALLALAACSDGGGSRSSPPPPMVGPSPPPSGIRYTVSGRVLADPILAADSDLNDPARAPRSNDGFSLAQEISADTEVRGYITRTPTGRAADNFATVDDRVDVFTAELEAGQVISLSIADFSPQTSDQLDLDLYLYDSGGDLVSSSIAFSAEVEQITVTRAGRYFIAADAFAGGSNYSLVISDAATTGGVSAAQVNVATMADDQVITLDADAERLSGLIGHAGDTGTGQAGPARRLRTAHARDARATRPARGPLSAGFPERVFGVAARSAGTTRYDRKLALLAHIKATNHRAGRTVVTALHYPRLHGLPPEDPELQWNLPLVEWQEALDTVEAAVPDPDRPLIAVLDSGVFSSHPKIAPVLEDARDFVPSFIDGDGFDAEAEEDVAVDESNTDECFDFHGTHVASIAAAAREGGRIGGRTMVGALPFADLMVLKLGYNRDPQCRLIVGDVAGAIRYAAGLPNSSGRLPPRPADVINMSFGGTEPNPATRAAIREAAAAGVILVASAGNEGDTDEAGIPNYPAAYPEVIGVGAVDIDARRAVYSSFYPQVEIAAPGGDTRFDTNGDGLGDGIIGGVARLDDAGGEFRARYALYQGTSMAAPHVAAGFALMKSIYPALDTEEAHRLLEEGLLTEDIGAPGRDSETGFGLVSFRRMAGVALQLRGDSLQVAPDFRVTPEAIDFGNIGEAAEVSVLRSGNPDFRITSVTFASPGLDGGQIPAPEPIDVDAEGFGTYRVRIDRSLIGAGTYAGEVTVLASNGESRKVPVTFTVPDASLASETGPAHVELQRLSNGAFVRVRRVVVRSGAGAEFALNDLDTGTYRLVYSTDMDNDDRLCDPGELGGSYPGRDCDSGETFTLPGAESDLVDAVLRRLPQ